MNLGPHTVTVINPGTAPSDYGNGTRDDWDTATEVDVHGCSVQPAMGLEYTTDRDNVATRWVVWMPPTAPVSGRSRIRWGDHTYDVDGSPQMWGFPPLDHYVVNLRRSEG